MQKKNKKQARLTRVRASLRSSDRHRLTVTRTNLHMWAQVIDDAKHKTIVAVSTKTLERKNGMTKTMLAAAVGHEIARLTLAQNITKIVFDRGPYKFHGRVKALAEAARSGGLEF